MTLCEQATNDFDAVAEVYDALVAWAPYGQWVGDLLERLSARGLPPGGCVLDAACGTGLSTLPLVQKGYDVVGVDCSEAMLERARERFRRAGLEAPFLAADLTTMDLGRSFDAVVCMHSGLDYILDLADLARAFERVRAHLHAGALFAFDKCIDEADFYKRPAVDRRRMPGGVAVFRYTWDRRSKIFQQHCVVLRIPDGEEPQRLEFVHRMLAVSVKKLEEMLREAGFEMLEPPEQFCLSDPGMGISRAV